MNIINVVMDWLHLLATTVWIGGMFFNIVILRPSLAIVDPQQRVKLVDQVLSRFLYLAWISIFTLIVTGILTATPTNLNYGILLSVKHAIVTAMVFIVAMISFILFPKLRKLVSQTGSTKLPSEMRELLSRIVLLVKLNLSLGIVVLLFTAAMQEI
ncbi:CopD family protein [Candidatus Hecatella orcuttiae]|jgi:uncharacterized membrane protein|uniref:CopD family protein n=1 Tax=Candidatus Hecatella orcuttiae TaxID=1935119 RepID=UPI002868326B|nr:CopD family protein [Candidatus Hecatella orcuttiae]